MKKLIKGVLFLIFIGLVTYACKKITHDENNDSYKQIDINYLKSDVKDSLSTILSKIGDDHNFILDSIFSNFNWSNHSYEEEIKKQFSINKIDYKENTCDYDCQKEYLGDDIRFIDEAIALEQNGITSYNNYLQCVQLIYENASKEVQDENKRFIILAFLKVHQSSVYYWYPSSIGASGVGDSIIGKIRETYEPVVAKAPPGWATADASALSGGLVVGGIVAGVVGGPIGVGAFFGRIIGGAAFASAMHAAR